MRAHPFQLNVSELLSRPGEPRRVLLRGAVGNLETSSAWVGAGDEVELDLTLEGIAGGLTAAGQVRVKWEGSCRRCLEPVFGELDIHVHEIFSREPPDEDVRPIDDDTVDLEPIAREAILLELPLAPLCRAACPGPAPESYRTGVEERSGDDGSDRDPRWDALDQLRFPPED